MVGLQLGLFVSAADSIMELPGPMSHFRLLEAYGWGLFTVATATIGPELLVASLRLNTTRRAVAVVLAGNVLLLPALVLLPLLPPHDLLRMYGTRLVVPSLLIVNGINGPARGASRPTTILLPPASWLRSVLVFILTPRVIERIVDPVLADIHGEWAQAVAAGRRRLWTIHLRAYLYVLEHLAYAVWREILR
jgi:hypothetical protein